MEAPIAHRLLYPALKRLPFVHCPDAGDRSISISSGRVGVVLLFGKPEETNQQDCTSLKLVL